jgi:3-mercaptopyruvate sulfurtransferase SseA
MRSGWADARPLLGGWKAWKDSGLPVEAKPEED